jgi:hypothetical protein
MLEAAAVRPPTTARWPVPIWRPWTAEHCAATGCGWSGSGPTRAGRSLDQAALLLRLGAAAADESGVLRPTAAGLLMFGSQRPSPPFFPVTAGLPGLPSRRGVFMALVSPPGTGAAMSLNFYLRVRRGPDLGRGPAVADAVGKLWPTAWSTRLPGCRRHSGPPGSAGHPAVQPRRLLHRPRRRQKRRRCRTPGTWGWCGCSSW